MSRRGFLGLRFRQVCALIFRTRPRHIVDAGVCVVHVALAMAAMCFTGRGKTPIVGGAL